MSKTEAKTVQAILAGTAQAMQMVAPLVPTMVAGPVGSTVGQAVSVIGRLFEALIGLFDDRPAEEVIRMIQDLRDNPARRVDLSGLDAEVRDAIRERRDEEG